MKSNRGSSLLVVLCFLLSAATALAQTTISTIEGTIKDAQGSVISGAQVVVKSQSLGIERTATSDGNGFYRIAALPAGNYTLTISHTGFAPRTFDNVELTLNRTLTLDIPLEVGAVQEQVDVVENAQLLNPTSAATGSTITPQQIKEMPTNGRNYLDLMQLVPGVVINRQANVGSDNATPVLGERSGNNNFLIDGQPNKDTVGGGAAFVGGAASQFNQETIAEFQVLTAGFRAEFGQASGAIVNVITKSGGNQYHGLASIFFRNNIFDSSNSLDPLETEAPFLQRWDYSLALGGPIVKDKVFFFASGERIRENRELNFVPPPGTPQIALDFENQFDNPSRTFDTRGFFKLDEQLGRHSLSQSVSYTNGNVREFLPLSNATDLPSRRNDLGARHLLLSFSDTILAGDRANPWVLTLRGGYRGDTSETRPAHPEAGVGTTFQMFSSNNTGGLFGNLGSFGFGNPNSRQALDQKYTSASANANKLLGDHNLKFGWNFLRTRVDGIEFQVQNLQLFATVPDFIALGPINSGFFTVTTAGGLTPEANEIHLRNNYNAIFAQDDWKFLPNLTLNVGVRWDYDSEFVTKQNVSPRLGFAWAATPKTIVRGHFGLFYDQFRLGLVQDVPAFGGADRRVVQPFSYPRGFYGVPTLAPALINSTLFPGGLCVSPNLTDAQITTGNVACPFSPGLFIGIDRLNRVVAPGHAFIPANSVINVSNIQTLSGLSPDQYLLQAAAAVGKAPGFFFWGPFGALSHAAIPGQLFPTDIDRAFETPFTSSFSIGVQREIKNVLIEVDYYHRNMNNLLGLRQTNTSFASRASTRQFLPPFAAGPIRTFGPWYEGTYDGVVISFTRRFARRFSLSGNYAYAHEVDNQLGINSLPSDSFVGVAPIVTETTTGRTNEHSSFTRANGRFVEKAGTFVNGPDLDKGPSDLSVDHTFQLNGLLELPWQFQVSGIFRAQSGFHFSRQAPQASLEDPDGDGTFNTIDHRFGRNAFTAPPFVNLDLRVTKRFNITERVKIHALFEFFNVFNRQNPAAVEGRVDNVNRAFGTRSQVLPGREGQVGLRLEF
jgi:outer membrane receptor protein involved in Fe transport